MTHDTHLHFSKSGVAMDKVSPKIAESTRNNISAILRAMSAVGQCVVADRLDVNSSSITRMKEEGSDVERMGLILAASGLDLIALEKRIKELEELSSSQMVVIGNLLAQKEKPEVSSN